MTEPVLELLAQAKAARQRGQLKRAVELYRRVLDQEPEHLDAAVAVARNLFDLEDWPAAWRAFDVRMRLMDSPPVVTRQASDGSIQPFPQWTGGPPPRRLFVMGEQGLGDTIQFARYLPLIAQMGVTVDFVVDGRLNRLLGTGVPGVRLHASRGQGQLRGIDGWCLLMSVPGLIGVGPGRFTPRMPYLFAEAERAARWQSLCRPDRLNIGLCWQGNNAQPSDAHRSAPLAAFAPLAALPHVNLIALQRGAGLAQIGAVPFGARIVDPGQDFDAGPDAFVDTAGLMTHLDLVISVDTAVAHVAGALGRPVWIALSADHADWRWLMRPQDTVWYPSARLFRQKQPGDWRTVAEDMAQAASRFVVFRESAASLGFGSTG